MLKRALSILVALSLLSALTTVSVFATGESPNSVQEQVNSTLKTVFEYLNGQTLSLRHLEEKTYNIPVGDEIVTVTIKNEQVPSSRYVIDEDYYIIKPNTSYTYTLNINNFYSGSGSAVCKVYYEVGEPMTNTGPDNEVYRMYVKNASITVTPPNFYSLRDADAYVDHECDGSPVVKAAAAANFENVILKPVNLTVAIILTSMRYSQLIVKYEYDNLYE